MEPQATISTRKALEGTLHKQQYFSFLLAIRQKEGPCEIGRNEKRSLLGMTSKPPHSLLGLLRCPYTIDMRLWNLRDRQMRMVM